MKVLARRHVCLISLSAVGVIFFIFQMLTLNYQLAFWSKPEEKLLHGVVAGGWRTANSSIVILYWTSVFDHKVNVTGRDEQYKWPFFAKDENCPVKCELTTNKSRVGEASAVVIHGRDTDEMPTSSNHHTIPWIFHVNESPVYTTAFHDENIMRKFSYFATYRLDSDFPCPQFLKPKLTKPVPFAQKTRLSVAIYSHCEDTRTLYLHRLMKYMQVDSYGKCLQNKAKIAKRKSGNNDHLQAVMAKYKFTFIFPNSDCDYYMTEKIYNALSSGSVPVWMGTDTIDEVLQWGNLKYSVIKVRDFKSPRQLANYLLWLSQNEMEYNRFLKWKYEGFNFPKEYYDSNIGVWWEKGPLYCRVCMKLAKDNHFRSSLNTDKCDGKQRRTLEKWIRE
jgi:alpha-1,3-fucosyltransferase 10